MNKHAVTDVKENGPSKRREPIVVFMGHCDDEDERSDHEFLPEFTTLYYLGSNPEILSPSPPQLEEDDTMFPDNVDPDDLQEENDYMHWPELPPKFASEGYYGMVPSKPVSDLDETDNLEGVPRTRILVDDHSKEKNESWPLKISEIGTPVLLEERNTSTAVDKETLPNPVDKRNHTIKHTEDTEECHEDDNTSAVTNTPSNCTVSNEHFKMCPNHPVDARYWMHEDDGGVCIMEPKNLGLSIGDLPTLISLTREDTPMQLTPVDRKCY